MSLRIKILAVTLVLVATGLLLTGLVTVTMTRSAMLDRVDATLEEASLRPPPSPLPQAPQAPGPQGSQGQGPGRGQNDPGPRQISPEGPNKFALAVLVLGSDGSLLGAAPSGFANDPDPLPDLGRATFEKLTSGHPFELPSTEGTPNYRVTAIPQRDGSTLVLAAPLTDVDATTAQLVVVWVVASLAVLAFLTITGWLVVARGLAPVGQMALTAEDIAAGDVTAKDMARRMSHADPTTEIGRLGVALNTMLEKIETAFAARTRSEERLRHFVADASHELRTPTAAIRGYAELYRTGASRSPEDVEHAMLRIESEAKRMGDLVESLLLLARLDQGHHMQRSSLDLGSLVLEAVSDARAREPERQVAVSIPRDEPAVIEADESRTRQVIGNLLGNALTHTPPASPVKVTVEHCHDGVALHIDDSGAGIAPADRLRVFERFARLESSRSRETGGAGLGLSIAKSIVEAHGGTILVDDSPLGGARLSIYFPARPAAPDPSRTQGADPALHEQTRT